MLRSPVLFIGTMPEGVPTVNQESTAAMADDPDNKACPSA